MAGQDISWSTPRETFNLRVAAVIGHGHKVLLCTVDGLGYWFLPGGRVRFRESAQLALSRELTRHINPGTRPSVEAGIALAPYGQDRLDRTSRYPSGSAIVTPHRSQYGLRASTRMPPASIRRLTTSSSITPLR